MSWIGSQFAPSRMGLVALRRSPMLIKYPRSHQNFLRFDKKSAHLVDRSAPYISAMIYF